MPNISQFDSVSDQRITIVDFAEELGIRKQTIFKVVKRLGIIPQERRESSRGNQLVKTISSSEAAIIKNELNHSGNADVQNDSAFAFLGDEVGVFYLIQLEPDHDKGRFKVGFTTDLDGRVRKHRCSAPLLQCVKSWPCRMAWERTVIDCITDGCDQLHTEVFRAISIDDIIARADKFFALMPTPKQK